MGIDYSAILGAGDVRSKFGCFCRWSARGWWHHFLVYWCTTMWTKKWRYTLVYPAFWWCSITPWWHRAICMIIPPRPAAHPQIGTYNSWKAFSRPGGCWSSCEIEIEIWAEESAVGGFNPHCGNLDISRGTGPCTSLAWLTVSSSTAALPS